MSAVRQSELVGLNLSAVLPARAAVSIEPGADASYTAASQRHKAPNAGMRVGRGRHNPFAGLPAFVKRCLVAAQGGARELLRTSSFLDRAGGLSF